MRWSTSIPPAAAFALVTCLAPRIASAADPPSRPGEMIVYLRGAKEIRGAIVDVAPGKHYVVLRTDGTTLKLPWSAVRAVTAPNGPPPPPEPAPEPERSERPEKADAPPRPPVFVSVAPVSDASSDEPPPKPRPKGPVAFVEIRSEKRIQLQWSSPGSGSWETACMSPCNTALPVEGSYRVVDDSGKPGKAFVLPHDGKVVIQQVSRSTGMDVMGGIALTAGGIAFLGGTATAEDARSDDSGPAVAILFGLSAMTLGTVLLCV